MRSRRLPAPRRRPVCLPGALCCLLVVAGGVRASGVSAPRQTPAPTLAGSALGPGELQAFPELAAKVTVSSAAAPLAGLLEELSRDTRVDLRLGNFPARLRHQRVTVATADEPLWSVMERLVVLLSHGEDGRRRRQYYWQRTPPQSKDAPRRVAYRLVRDGGARLTEREELARPYREALRQLKDMRELARLAPDRRDAYATRLSAEFVKAVDSSLEAQALKGLSDVQLRSLLGGERIVVPAAPLRPAFERRYVALVERYRASGDPREFPPFEMRDEWVTLEVGASFFDEEPARPVTYMLSLAPGKVTGPTVGGGMHLNGVPPLSREGLLDEGAGGEEGALPVFDLSPVLDAPGVTDRQRGDLAFTLAALAKVARVPVYQEHFLKPGVSGSGLMPRKGTLPQLVNAICRNWNWQVTRHGDACLFWSRTWARDREADIDEPTLARWRQRLAARPGAGRRPCGTGWRSRPRSRGRRQGSPCRTPFRRRGTWERAAST